jgi:hypothetical protein
MIVPVFEFARKLPGGKPRRYFFATQNRLICIHGGGGDVDETWVVGRMGESLKKK